MAEELDEQRSGHVEALHHGGVHVAHELVALARDRLELAPQPARRQQEDRQQHERDERELPGQEEHDDQHDADADEVADHGGEDVGERLLGADDVVVEPADQRAGLGAREERQRHALDVVEDPGAHVVDEALADARADVALGERERGVAERQAGDQEGEPDDQAASLPRMPLSMISR